MVAVDEAVEWVALRAAENVGDIVGRRLIEHFGSVRAALEAEPAAVTGARFSVEVACGLTAANGDRGAASDGVERLRDRGARVVPLTADEYPELLRHVTDAPLYLIALGEPLVAGPALAVVGARHASAYGRDVAARLAEDLALSGVTVISGLARGVDGAAHRGALRAGGRTVAVVGTGIDVVYPKEHRELCQQILQTGTVLTEQPLGSPPHPAHFPRRNRIIAGMTHGTVVVEAAGGSGSLITARLALDLGREVFAVPGRIDSPLSVGTNHLIQQGAKLVTGVDDLLSEITPALRSGAAGRAVGRSGGPADGPIASLLGAGPTSVDQLIRETGLPASELLRRLLDLELRGLITRSAGNFVELVR